jgi:hypothetical protein
MNLFHLTILIATLLLMSVSTIASDEVMMALNEEPELMAKKKGPTSGVSIGKKAAKGGFTPGAGKTKATKSPSVVPKSPKKSATKAPSAVKKITIKKKKSKNSPKVMSPHSLIATDFLDS